VSVDRRELAEACARADATGKPVFLADQRELAEAPEPLALLDAGAGDRVYWEQPERGRWSVAWGTAARFEAEGAERFERLSHAIAAWFGELTWLAGEPARGPRAWGGLAFAPEGSADPLWRDFPPAGFQVPLRSWTHEGGRCFETRVVEVRPGEATAAVAARLERLAAPPGPPAPGALDAACAPGFAVRADRPHERYRAQVRDATDAIERGELEKVVLARSLSVRTDGAFARASFLRGLRELHPSCTCFAFARGSALFAGATPERLVALSGDRVRTAAVAGTAPRGRNPEEDARLARSLCESPKEQREHALVVEAVRAALADAAELSGPERPELLRLEGLQHLHTPLSGPLREAARRPRLLDLAERLHPSPAVGGTPRRSALHWIDRHEELDRGWYAGPVGFVEADGGGELWVALRSALVRDGEARLYAGAGIVAGSEPEAELRETRLKLRAVLAPLTEI